MRLIDADALKEIAYEMIQEDPEAFNGGYACNAVTVDDIDEAPTVDAVQVVHGRWEDGRCSNCNEEALSSTWDEEIYDYDWEENVRFSHIETHVEYHLTNFCPNCGAKMDGKEEV